VGQLGVDRRKLRVSLPVAGLRVSIDYDAAMVDQMIECLTVLRHTIQTKTTEGQTKDKRTQFTLIALQPAHQWNRSISYAERAKSSGRRCRPRELRKSSGTPSRPLPYWDRKCRREARGQKREPQMT